MSQPFEFPAKVATVLAQICCHNGILPQGAPTSPIISNMIARSLDTELMELAREGQATYTRYADDITFSFSCFRSRLPKSILTFKEEEPKLSDALIEIIERNDFEVNFQKVRLGAKSSRMEVTGLTVNEFINVPRSYVRNISSILNAWRRYGYQATEAEFIQKFDKKIRNLEHQPSLIEVLKGKLIFLKNIRGDTDNIFLKLAKQFNELVPIEYQFQLAIPLTNEQRAIKSLWVIEDDEDFIQGTGFSVAGYGLITCAHVALGDHSKARKKLIAYQYDSREKLYQLRVEKYCEHRDIAICQLVLEKSQEINTETIPIFLGESNAGEVVTLLGHPQYSIGDKSPNISKTTITKIRAVSSVNQFNIEASIIGGNSGGPIINSDGEVIGIAIKGIPEGSESNLAVCISELIKLRDSE